MWKKLLLSSISLATLTACASPTVTSRVAYREAALHAANVSGGACDDVGQLIQPAARSELIFEASAAPAH